MADPLGHTTSYFYDLDHNLYRVTDAKGQRSTATINAAGETTKVVRADLSEIQADYWPDGAVKEIRDGAGQPTKFEYDAAKRLTAEVDSIGRRTTFGHDPAGNVVTKASLRDLLHPILRVRRGAG